MPETLWEQGPWTLQLNRNSAGLVDRAQIVGAKLRVVHCTTMHMERDRAGRQHIVPGSISTKSNEGPAIICQLGPTYAGLPPETLIANADLITAAPDLYEALEALVNHGLDEDQLAYLIEQSDVVKARAALAKARGEKPDAR